MSAEGEPIFEESVQTADVVEANPANDNKLLLTARYAYTTICKSYPLADIGDCDMTQEEALWWAFEHTVEEINPELRFTEELAVRADVEKIAPELRFTEELPVRADVEKHLQELVRPEDLAMLKLHWQKLEKAKESWQMMTRSTWKGHLEKAPQRDETEQTRIDEILVTGKIDNISNEQRRMISAIVPLENDGEDLKQWRNAERSFRKSGYDAFQEYIRGLRAYYELLIQALKRGTGGSIRERNNFKQKVAIANRIARAVDAGFFSMMGAKSITHEQVTPPGKKDSRLRESGKAFIEHPYESMLRNLFDTLPFYINSPQLPKFSELIAHIIATALHDIPEDSRYDEKRALETIRGLLHHVDSTFSQHITHSPDGNTMEKFLKQTLSLMIGRNNLKRVLVPILRALNKNYKLSDDEMQAALLRNTAGTKTSSILTSVVTPDNQHIVTDPTAYDHDAPQLQLFEEFPESVEPKMDAFIIKLMAIADGSAESKKSKKKFVPQGEDLSTIILWTTLTVKMGERCHNTDEMREGKPKYALRTVRANSTRLIPFALEILAQKQDKFGEKNFSFYNVLPRLICSTLREYEKLVGEENPELTQADHTNIANLKRWAQENPILSIDAYLEDPNTPDVVKQDMARYREKIAGVMADDAIA